MPSNFIALLDAYEAAKAKSLQAWEVSFSEPDSLEAATDHEAAMIAEYDAADACANELMRLEPHLTSQGAANFKVVTQGTFLREHYKEA